MKNLKIVFMVALVVCLFIPEISHAADSGLEIETSLDKVLGLLKGRVAWFVGVGSIIIATAGWAASEGGSMARSGFKLMMALAIMFNAVKIASALFSASEGMGF